MNLDDIDLNDLFPSLGTNKEPDPASDDKTQKKTERPFSIERKTKNIYRRAFSETKLLEILPYELEQNTSYHVLTAGDVDALSYVRHITRTQPLDYLLCSTWCMESDDIAQIAEWLKSGRIGRVDMYVGEIFPGSYRKHYVHLQKVILPHGGRVAVFRNHSKTFAGIGPKYAFGVLTSANVNTNPRTENGSILVDHEAYHWLKTYFDGINPFNGNPPGWKPFDK